MREGIINNKSCAFEDNFLPNEHNSRFPYRYFISDNGKGDPCCLTIEKPTINFWGTAYFREPIKFRKFPDMLMIRDWGWL